MTKESGNGNSETTHRCGRRCFGPLTFHPQAVGEMVRLSHGHRFAERAEGTFKNGLVFSSRPLKINERFRLMVEKGMLGWHGALRVGFTNVPPSARLLPLPIVAIPNLTDMPGHWAAPVHESLCQPGSELEFWVSGGGNVYVTGMHIKKHKLLTGVDVRKPLWATIDIYGQTCSILLLGSVKRSLFRTRRSCPAPDNHHGLIPHVSSLFGNCDKCISCRDLEDPADGGSVRNCVVCFDKPARITLPCGHRCLCHWCFPRISQQFGTCPLCRHTIDAASAERSVSGSL